MAPRYSLLGDEDLNALLEPDALNAVRPTAAEMAPSPQQPQAQQQPALNMPPRDPELENAWRGLEMQQIQKAQGDGGGYGIGEGLRDTVPTLLALGLDAGFNHGRGALGIVQGGMGAVAAQQAERDRQTQNAGELAVKLHGKGQDAAAMARLQYNYDALHARENAAGGVQGRYDLTRNDRNHLDSERNQTELALKELGAGRTVKGTVEQQTLMNPTIAGNAANVRTAETNAELGAKHAGAPLANADEADKARQVAEARVPSEQTIKQTPTAADNRQQGLTDLAQSPIPGIEVTDQNAYRAMNPDATRRAANEKYVSAGINTIEKLRAMEAARAEVGPVWNSLNDQEKRVKLDQMANDRLLAIGGLSTMGNTATLNAGEFPRYGEGVPSGGFERSDAWDAILGATPGMSARDTQLEKLQGTRKSVEDAFNRGLQMMGARYGGPQTPGAGATAQPPPSDQLPGEVVPADLGVTGGYKQRDVPPITAAPGGGGPLRHIRKPNGTVVPTMKSDAELAALPEGYQVID